MCCSRAIGQLNRYTQPSCEFVGDDDVHSAVGYVVLMRHLSSALCPLRQAQEASRSTDRNLLVMSADVMMHWLQMCFIQFLTGVGTCRCDLF